MKLRNLALLMRLFEKKLSEECDMSNNIKMINGGQHQNIIENSRRALKYADVWSKYYNRELQKGLAECIDKGDLSHEQAVKLAFIGTKYVISLLDIDRQGEELYKVDGKRYEQSEEVRQNLYDTIDRVYSFIGFLTIRDLLSIFPIRKDYDGELYQCKDYFYTVEALSKMDWDKPIGRDNVFSLMWDYCNEDLERILMEYMCLVSDLHKKKTGKGFAEVFSEMYNIPSYSINKDAGLIQDNQTGEIIKMDNKKQSHIKIIK